jgi:lipoate-protein ligase A
VAAERPWRVEPPVAATPSALVAATEAALEALARDPTPRLRWYRSTAPALVRGRGQRGWQPADPGAVALDRPTGGGAVWLDPGLLSCDVLVPAGHPLAAGEPLATFDRVGAAWRDALVELGVEDVTTHTGASTAQRRGDARQRLLASVCFATRGRGEVLLHERKLVGLSQRRRRSGVLIQCGLLRRWRPGALLTAVGADPDDAEIARAAVGLDEALARPPTDTAIADAVSARLAGWRGGDPVASAHPPPASPKDEP